MNSKRKAPKSKQASWGIGGTRILRGQGQGGLLFAGVVVLDHICHIVHARVVESRQHSLLQHRSTDGGIECGRAFTFVSEIVLQLLQERKQLSGISSGDGLNL